MAYSGTNGKTELLQYKAGEETVLLLKVFTTNDEQRRRSRSAEPGALRGLLGAQTA